MTQATELRIVADGAELVDVVRTIVTEGGGELWIVAYGGSMTPAIPHGSRIRVVPARDRDLKAGSIAFALVRGAAVVHRIALRVGGRILLHGDSMAWSDPPIDRNSILALVDAVRVNHEISATSERAHPSIQRRLRRLPRQIGVLTGLVRRFPPGTG